jgi:hypothetical protein
MGSTVGVAILGTVFGTGLASAMHERMETATQGAPAAVRAQFLSPPGAGAAEEAPRATGAFDAARLKGTVHARFDVQRSLARSALEGRDAKAAEQLLENPALDPRLKTAVMQGAPYSVVESGLNAAEQAAMVTLDKVGQAMKEAFAEAISRIYRIAMLIAALGALLTLVLPELPLGHSTRLASVPAE